MNSQLLIDFSLVQSIDSDKTCSVTKKICANCKKEYTGRKNKYCSHECLKQGQKILTQCDYCQGDYYADRSSRRKYCSDYCSKYGRFYGTKNNYLSIVETIKYELESGIASKQIAKKHNISYTAIKRVIDDFYDGKNPQHFRAVKLYKSGICEEDIAKTLNVNVGAICTWLYKLVDGYTKPKKQALQKEKARKEKKQFERHATAKALSLYRKFKNVRLVANELDEPPERIRAFLASTKGYKKIRSKLITLGHTKQQKRLHKISTKYKNEKHFSDHLASEIADYFPGVQREAASGTTTNIDILVKHKNQRAVIECKWDVKITNIHKAIGQVMVAKNKLFASVAIVCWPDDVFVSSEAISDCNDVGVFACPESGVIDLLKREFSKGIVKV